jgi:hypothetical protein
VAPATGSMPAIMVSKKPAPEPGMAMNGQVLRFATCLIRFATSEPTVCAVCRRRAVWLGYAPPRQVSRKGRTRRLALRQQSLSSRGKEHLHDACTRLDAFEADAALEAGEQAGAFLEDCGTTDLAQLTPEQWQEFLRRLLTGFEQALRRRILTGESPF